MKLILLVVLFVVLARSQDPACGIQTSLETCNAVTTTGTLKPCTWCDGKGCLRVTDSLLNPCEPPPVINDCANRQGETDCTTPKENTIACSFCNQKCVPTASLLPASTPGTAPVCPPVDNPCAVPKEEAACLNVVGTDNPSVKLCRWCPTIGCLRVEPNSVACPEPTPICKECPLADKPARKCRDGSVLQSECDLKTCTWVPIETEPCKFDDKCPNGCPVINDLAVRLCSDQVTVQTRICNLATCAYDFNPCPGCEKLCTDKPYPSTADGIVKTSGCADGSVSGFVCDTTKCDWYFRPCPNVDNPVCPNGNTASPCLMNPCAVPEYKCDDPLAIRCEANYCNGCGREATIWYREGGVRATCSDVKPPPPKDCTDPSACDGKTKPTTDRCTEPKIFCAATSTGECEYRALCPDVVPTCDANSGCGNAAKDETRITQCSTGVGSWVCNYQNLPFTSKDVDTASTTVATTVRSCSWDWQCPPPPPNDPTVCKIGGLCGRRCVAAASTDAANLILPDVAKCKAEDSCEDKCFFAFARLDTCGRKADGACRFEFTNGAEFERCMKICANPSNPPPPIDNPCRGDVCSCPYDKCSWCRRTYSTMVNGAATTYEKAECIGQNAICLNEATVRAALTVDRPDICFAVPTAITNDGTDTRPELVKNVDKIDPVKIQAELSTLANKVPEVKDFIVAIKDQFDPQENTDGSVKVSVVVTITGDRDPSTNEQDLICRKVVIDGIKETLRKRNVNVDFVLRRCEKIVTTTKRGILSSTGDLVVSADGTGSTPGGNNNTGSAASLFVSLAALILAMLALFF